MHRKVHFATGNMGKLQLMVEALRFYDIAVTLLNYSHNVPDGSSVQAAASSKATAAFKMCGEPVIAHAVGLYIPALQGWPGADLDKVIRQSGAQSIIAALRGLPSECKLKYCLAYADAQLECPMTFVSSTFGSLAREIQSYHEGTHRSPIAPIYIPIGSAKTLSQMSPVELQVWRCKVHRSQYIGKFVEWLNVERPIVQANPICFTAQ